MVTPYDPNQAAAPQQSRLPSLNPGFLQALSGFASGNNVGEQFGNVNALLANQNEQQKADEVKNKTLAILEGQSPEIAAALKAGAMTPQQAMSAAMQQRQAAADAAKPKYQLQNIDGKLVRVDVNSGKTDQLGDYSTAAKPNLINVGNGLLYDADTKQYIKPPADIAQNNVKHALTPIWGKKDGKLVFGTLAEDGSFNQTEIPEGFEPQPGTSVVDLGTSVVVRNNKTGDTVRTMEKDIAGVETQKVLGENEGNNIAAAPKDLQAGLNAKGLIQKMKVDPNREWGTGVSSVFNVIPGTPGYDYQTKVNQSKSGAFLTAIEQMRGLGALSNAEGQTATAAVTRMDTATSEGAFMEALADYERVIDQGIARAESRMRSNPTSADQAQQPSVNKTTTGTTWKEVPQQ